MKYMAKVTFENGTNYGWFPVDAPDEESAEFAAEKYVQALGRDDRITKIELSK